MEQKNKSKLNTVLIIAILVIVTILQTVQIGQLMKANEYQQEINVELNERITLLETK